MIEERKLKRIKRRNWVAKNSPYKGVHHDSKKSYRRTPKHGINYELTENRFLD
mgnify:FL=1|jgi:hypothetical protein|tara:strand:- start:867 stop:1025 length:159 start_codon:yes stop_codon:yes gene_type:complete